jgi:hypothetical protein
MMLIPTIWPLEVGFPPDWWMLAEIPMPPMPVTAMWLWGLLGALGIVLFLLRIWNEGVKTFGRTPPLDDKLRALESKIDAAALRTEVTDLHAQIIPRAKLEGDFQRMEKEMLLVHDSLQHGQEQTQLAVKELQNLIDSRFAQLDQKRSTDVSSLHKELTETRERLAGVEATTETNVQTLHSLDSKIDNLRSNPPRRT